MVARIVRVASQRLPFDEVAQRMGRSRPAVQMLWMRAIERLHERLAALEDASSVASDPGAPP